MTRALLGAAFAACLIFGRLTLAFGFVEDTPPTFENGGVDPAQTGDPAAVAAAQRQLASFFDNTNLNYSIIGYTNPRVMREELGNNQTDWLDQSMALACGRLVHGWKYLSWVPTLGWCECAAPPTVRARAGAAVSCEYTPPTAGNGGVDPSTTIDPLSVAAVQRALADFYAYTNLHYSARGYSNPQVMREELGNSRTDWLDQSLALARGRLVGGWKNMNWVPGFGWCKCATSRSSQEPAAGSSRWQYSVADRTLVAHLGRGDPAAAESLALPIYPSTIKSALADFAVEVRVAVSPPRNETVYGLRYSPETDDFYRLVVLPASGRYGVWSAREQRWLAEGPLGVAGPASEPSLLRLELRGDTMGVFLNDRLLGRLQQPGLARRGGVIHLDSGLSAPPADGDVEVRYSDFRMYPLTP